MPAPVPKEPPQPPARKAEERQKSPDPNPGIVKLVANDQDQDSEADYTETILGQIARNPMYGKEPLLTGSETSPLVKTKKLRPKNPTTPERVVVRGRRDAT